MTASVALTDCPDYGTENVAEALEKLMSSAPPPDVAGKTVLLKPNMLSPKKSESAVCTHPAVVAAAVCAFLRRGAAKVLVGESPAVSNPLSAAKISGIYDAMCAAGGEWVTFDKPQPVPCPDGKLIISGARASVFSDVDGIVSLPKLKTHQLMGYTGAMKNMFGLMVGLDKAQSHFRFSEREDFAAFLTDVNIAAHASYAIMDGVIAMEGPGGPGNGDPVKVGMMAASDNLLALDWICASCVGYDPHTVPNLEDALKRGIWLQSPDDIKLSGVPLENLRPKHFRIVQQPRETALLKPGMPGIFRRLASFYFTLRPYFLDKECIRCGKCIEICPARALSFQNIRGASGKKQDGGGPAENRHVVLDKKKCLHCYCCHEVCPANAIRLKRSW